MAEHHVALLAQLLRDIKSRQPRDDTTAKVVLSDSWDEDMEQEQVRDVKVPDTVTAKNVFRHPDAHPFILDLLLLKQYQEEWLGWEGETLEIRVPKDFGVDAISDLNVAKLQAVKTLHLVDTYWERWEVFVWVTMPLNAVFPDFQVMQVPTVLQCACSVDVANRIRDDMTWSEELLAYLGTVYQHDGILVPTPPMEFVRVETEGYPVDVDKVLKRWPDVRASRSAPSGGTPEDEQLRRMLEVFEGVEDYRALMRQQLKILRNV